MSHPVPNLSEEGWMETRVTLLSSVFKPKECQTVPLRKIVNLLKGDSLKIQTSDIRLAFPKGKNGGYDALKKALPAVIPSGVFDQADAGGLQSPAGLMVIDFDKLQPAQMEPSRSRLASDPHTLLLFVSPSGIGLKWVVPVSVTDEPSHKACFEVVKQYVGREYPKLAACLDTRCSDLSRKCFLCHDPNLIVKRPTERFAEPLQILIGNSGGNGSICEPVGQGVRGSGSQDVRGSVVQGNRGSSGLPSPSSPRAPHEKATGSTSIGPELETSLAGEDDVEMKAAVERLVPKQVHNTHYPLFDLARYCRQIERNAGIQAGTMSMADRHRLFDWWIEGTKPEYLSHKPHEYRTEFLEAFGDAKVPLDEDPLGLAWELSRTAPPPPEAWVQFPDADAVGPRRMFNLAYQLALLTGGRPIHMSSAIVPELAKAEGLEGLDHPMKIRRILNAMCGYALKEIAKANCRARRTTVYKYLLPLRREANPPDSVVED